MIMQTAAVIPADEDGSYPALAGVVPAPVGRRIGALVLETAIITVAFYGGSAALMAIGLASGSYDLAMYGPAVLGWGVAIAMLGAQIWCMLKRGHWVGGVLLKITHVNVQTGQPDPGKVFLKFLLQWIISTVTLGIGFIIIALVTMRSTTGRNWFDRVTGLMVIDLKNGPLPTAATATAAQYAMQPMPLAPSAIASVSLPQPPAWSPFAASPSAVGPPAPTAVPFMEVPAFAPAPMNRPPAAVPPPPPPVSTRPQQAAVPAPSAFVSQNPFGSPVAAPSQPIVPVDRPGADAFIEATPFSAAKLMPTPLPPAPLITAPVVVNERDLAPQADFGETVLDAAVLAPVGGARELVVDGDLVLPQGQITLLGRNPIALPTMESAVPIALADPAMKISKSHLAVGLVDGKWWVMDLHSTNGTAIVDANGTTTRCEPGVSTPMEPGNVIRFGSHEITARR